MDRLKAEKSEPPKKEHFISGATRLNNPQLIFGIRSPWKTTLPVGINHASSTELDRSVERWPCRNYCFIDFEGCSITDSW